MGRKRLGSFTDPSENKDNNYVSKAKRRCYGISRPPESNPKNIFTCFMSSFVPQVFINKRLAHPGAILNEFGTRKLIYNVWNISPDDPLLSLLPSEASSQIVTLYNDLNAAKLEKRNRETLIEQVLAHKAPALAAITIAIAKILEKDGQWEPLFNMNNRLYSNESIFSTLSSINNDPESMQITNEITLLPIDDTKRFSSTTSKDKLLRPRRKYTREEFKLPSYLLSESGHSETTQEVNPMNGLSEDNNTDNNTERTDQNNLTNNIPSPMNQTTVIPPLQPLHSSLFSTIIVSDNLTPTIFRAEELASPETTSRIAREKQMVENWFSQRNNNTL